MVDGDVVAKLGEQGRPRLADDCRPGSVDERVGLLVAAVLDGHLVAIDHQPTAYVEELQRATAVVLDPVLTVVGTVRNRLDAIAHRLLGEILRSLVQLGEPVEADVVEHRLQPALASAVGSDHAADVVEHDPFQSHVVPDERFPLGLDLVAANDPDCVEVERLRELVMRGRGESGNRRTAGVQDVLVDIAERNELPIVEERHHHAKVALVNRP